MFAFDHPYNEVKFPWASASDKTAQASPLRRIYAF